MKQLLCELESTRTLLQSASDDSAGVREENFHLSQEVEQLRSRVGELALKEQQIKQLHVELQATNKTREEDLARWGLWVLCDVEKRVGHHHDGKAQIPRT